MANKFTYSKGGLALTERFEGVRLQAYRDIRGRLTIGYGHCGPGVREGLVWTQAQAETALAADIQWASMVVNAAVLYPLTQCEFDALVDFVFNDGSGNFTGSTMLKLLNAGEVERAAEEFEKWDHAGGRAVAGLLRRRQAEAQVFREVQA